MQEHEVRAALLRLETSERQVVPAAARAKAAMFAAFDSTDADEDDLDGRSDDFAAEITLLPQPESSSKLRHRVRTLVPAAAAAVILILVGTQIGNDGRFDPSFVVAADAVTAESDSPALIDDRSEAPIAPFVGGDLPRLIDEQFMTKALGIEVSFVVDRPIWLTHHQPGAFGLSLDPVDPLAAEMFVARLESVSTDDSVIDFLEGEPQVGGQVNPIVVDGRDARYWRGRVEGGTAESIDCEPSEICLVVVDEPFVIGLRAERLTDIVELTLPDGDTLLLVASMPSADFGLEPFAEAFRSVFGTVSFSDEDAVGEDE